VLRNILRPDGILTDSSIHIVGQFSTYSLPLPPFKSAYCTFQPKWKARLQCGRSLQSLYYGGWEQKRQPMWNIARRRTHVGESSIDGTCDATATVFATWGRWLTLVASVSAGRTWNDRFNAWTEVLSFVHQSPRVRCPDRAGSTVTNSHMPLSSQRTEATVTAATKIVSSMVAVQWTITFPADSLDVLPELEVDEAVEEDPVRVPLVDPGTAASSSFWHPKHPSVVGAAPVVTSLGPSVYALPSKVIMVCHSTISLVNHVSSSVQVAESGLSRLVRFQWWCSPSLSVHVLGQWSPPCQHLVAE